MRCRFPNKRSMKNTGNLFLFLPPRCCHNFTMLYFAIFNRAYCTENVIKPLSTADFGKVMKQVFPNVRPRRLGTRGHSRYCYSGLRKKGELSPPILADLFCESETDHQKNAQLQNNQNPAADTPDLLKERACILVREWAEKLLGINFSGMGELANFLVDKLFVDQRSKAATQWNKLRSSHGQSDDENEVKAENGCEQEQMRELKRKLQVCPFVISISSKPRHNLNYLFIE